MCLDIEIFYINIKYSTKKFKSNKSPFTQFIILKTIIAGINSSENFIEKSRIREPQKKSGGGKRKKKKNSRKNKKNLDFDVQDADPMITDLDNHNVIKIGTFF